MDDLNEKIKPTYYKYLNLKKKWLSNNANIWFNRTCINNDIIPKFARCKNKEYSHRSKTTNIQYSKLCLQNENKFLYKKKDFLSLQLYHCEISTFQIFNKFWPIIKESILEILSNFTKTNIKI